ncbi:PQQ-dependent sugar dehydrogenase [Frigoriflavimonas asaccharolytica]|uniref:Glucose/arabinose dehydrogenase n=1 Tax=Frigoriflavimonas asaccharolytica TaxID=2735899 RepID=A0A8J8KA65_9FLAO|nr:PQQ-dependent sugar dehydrogenase [Frigoriflavimonas asaccharolytica]NRS91144.1 glucose/arabinose dehydrogenase [Frigoriflavimonas asaccharolytica]
MNLKLYKTCAISLLLVFTSCSGNSKSNTAENDTIKQNGLLPNPETESPNTSIKPAFSGQTRVQGIQTKTPIQIQTITENLGRPWGIINFENGQFLVTEKSGFAYLINKDGNIIQKIEGFPKVDDRAQGGLLDIALDPNFTENRMIYFTFSEAFGEGNLTSVGKGKLSIDNKKLDNVSVIFRATPSYDGRLHYGSRLVFDKDENLFVSTGERSDKETRPLAQDQQSYLGKIIKIDKNGKATNRNPSLKSWKPEIYSTGHRNPQGLAMDENNQLWEAEMGPKGGDEINLIKAGRNYGWPTITYGEEYSGSTIGNGIGEKTGLEQPVYYWDPSVSMSGITFYTGNISEWKNNLFLGCLSGQKIIRLEIKNNKVMGEEWLFGDKDERFRDVLDGADGNLYAITDSGKLYKISKK